MTAPAADVIYQSTELCRACGSAYPAKTVWEWRWYIWLHCGTCGALLELWPLESEDDHE